MEYNISLMEDNILDWGDLREVEGGWKRRGSCWDTAVG
jgi:hypothetical protein